MFERLLHGYDAQYTEQFRHSLRRDGYLADVGTGHIRPAGPQFAAASLAGLKDPSAIREQLDRIQRAVADDPAPAAGGPDAYEVVDGNGEVLCISSLDELSIGSMELALRKAVGAPEADTPAFGGASAPGSSSQKSAGADRPSEGPGAVAKLPQYHRYQLEVPNRSLVDPDTRRGLANLLQAVLDAVDPDTGGDIQLFDLHLNITADGTAVNNIEERGTAIGANWSEEELDF